MPKLIIAEVSVNSEGYEEFFLGERPFVHNTDSSADIEARRLCRLRDKRFAVFKRMYTVECQTTVRAQGPLTDEEITEAVSSKLSTHGIRLPALELRKLVASALYGLLTKQQTNQSLIDH